MSEDTTPVEDLDVMLSGWADRISSTPIGDMPKEEVERLKSILENIITSSEFGITEEINDRITKLNKFITDYDESPESARAELLEDFKSKPPQNLTKDLKEHFEDIVRYQYIIDNFELYSPDYIDDYDYIKNNIFRWTLPKHYDVDEVFLSMMGAVEYNINEKGFYDKWDPDKSSIYISKAVYNQIKGNSFVVTTKDRRFRDDYIGTFRDIPIFVIKNSEHDQDIVIFEKNDMHFFLDRVLVGTE